MFKALFFIFALITSTMVVLLSLTYSLALEHYGMFLLKLFVLGLILFRKDIISHFKKIKNKKKEIKTQEKLKEENEVLHYLQKLADLQFTPKQSTSKNDVFKPDVIEKLVQKTERIKDINSFHFLFIQYEDVFKNLYTALEDAMNAVDYITEEMYDNTVLICNGFLKSIEKEEEKQLKKFGQKIIFEKEYLEKQSNNNH